MSSVRQEDEFTEVTRKHKKRKASNSPMLPTQPKPSSSELSPGTPVRPKPRHENTIPAIMIVITVSMTKSKLEPTHGRTETVPPQSQNHKHQGTSRRRFCNYRGDSVQDVIVLQSETKMKAALGQKVKVCLPGAFRTSGAQTKSLAIKGVPTDITKTEFKGFLDLNKIIYAKAERLKSKRTAGSYQSFNSKLPTLPKPRFYFPKI